MRNACPGHPTTPDDDDTDLQNVEGHSSSSVQTVMRVGQVITGRDEGLAKLKNISDQVAQSCSILLMTGIAFLPTIAHAESKFSMEVDAPQAASAHLYFTIKVPGFVFLQAGTGGNSVSNRTAADGLYRMPVPNNGAKGWAQVTGNSGTITVSSGTPDVSNGVRMTYVVSMP